MKTQDWRFTPSQPSWLYQGKEEEEEEEEEVKTERIAEQNELVIRYRIKAKRKQTVSLKVRNIMMLTNTIIIRYVIMMPTILFSLPFGSVVWTVKLTD